jgi:glycosyltransferase involved in cell wall biosynthesis
VDRIIVGSPRMIESSPFLAPHAAKCRVVPFAIDVPTYLGDDRTFARAAELRAGHGRPIVLFVGRLVYYKGADVLLEAMRDVDADLVVIGQGPLEERLRATATAGGYADRVSFLAPVDLGELVAWYHAADVFVLPSVAVSEAYGLVQLEAHAAATPVVSTDLPTGVPFVNPDGETGLIVPPGDARALARALQKLVTDETLRATLGRRARERVIEEFTIDRMVDRILDVYAEAIDVKRTES